MTSQDPATRLLSQLGNFLGIDDLAFNDENCCFLELQEKFTLMARFDAQLNRLVLLAEFATPEKIPAELFSSILAFNAERLTAPGPWIALNEENGTFFLADDFFVQLIEPEIFKERLALFFQEYLACQGLLDQETLAAQIENNKRPSLSSSELESKA